MTQTPQPHQAASRTDRPGVVVDTRHLHQVLEVLGKDDLQLTVTATDHLPTLGLTRVRLSDSKGQLVEGMDGLLAEVRRRIAARHGGLVPPMGKDREIGSALTPMKGGNPRVTAAGTVPFPPDSSDRALEAMSGNPKVTGTVPSPVSAEGRTIRVGLVDTEFVEDWHVPDGGVQAWQGHASFVSHIVEAACEGVQIVHRAALTGGSGRGSGWAVACAITQLVAEGVDILLLPLACFTADGQPPLLIERALLAVPESILVIAAAGNQTLDRGWSAWDRGPTSPAWPAALARAKAVGADPAPFDGPALQPWVDAVTADATFDGPYFDGAVIVGHFDGDATVDPAGKVTVKHPDGTESEQHFTGAVTVKAGSIFVAFDGKAKWAGTSFCAAYAAGLVANRMVANPGTTAVEAWDALLDEPGGPLQRPPAPAKAQS